MNLHIAPDNVFINKFYENLQELGLSENNKIVIRTNNRELKHVKHHHPFAPLYSREFNHLVNDTSSYSKVFIHFFTPLLFRWVATNNFRQLGWMIWGADLYNLPFLKTPLYESQTLRNYVRGTFSIQNLLYRAKVKVLQERWKEAAYEKIDHILTWMKSEYDFARQNIPSLKGEHRFFFYENEVPYHALDQLVVPGDVTNAGDRPNYIIGNSSTPELNHVDAISLLQAQGVKAHLHLPVAYGDLSYREYLKKSLDFYTGGDIHFMEDYLGFEDYVRFLSRADGLIMNNVRPQGYGNILMMMYLGKQIFMNEKNLSTQELDKAGLMWKPIREVQTSRQLHWEKNRIGVSNHLSHDIALKTYGELFS
jgi:hypothetical protein